MKKLTRRGFIGTTATGIAGAAVTASVSSIGLVSCSRNATGTKSKGKMTAEGFSSEIIRVLPQEDSYAYHKRLLESPVHVARRDFNLQPVAGEMSLPDQGWKLVWNQHSTIIIQNAVEDFKDYLSTSMGVKVEAEGRDSLEGWQNLSRCIVVGTRDQLQGCGAELNGPKDYEIEAAPERLMVCGYDERGAMFGLYNIEARMNLREGPFLPGNLKTVRHSLYDTRMVQSWMGWMEFPDQLLSHMAHDGFDAIYPGYYANPNGDGGRSSREPNPAHGARMRDLINRAARFGIKIYGSLNYTYLGTPESEMELRKLVRGILKDCPEITGYTLLTEGFEYKKLTFSTGKSKEFMEDWIKNWTRAVSIAEEECHRINPNIEVMPWEYNIDFRPQNVDMKVNILSRLPFKTIPLITWENGASFKLGELTGYLRDYAINAVGPAEVTEAMITEAKKRGMKVYSKADTFSSWQSGSIPYLPCANQWYKRYTLLEKYGIKGTLESWSSGYNPNFISTLRAWTCWSDAPSMEELFSATASSMFGKEQKDLVIKAWEHFSKAISLVPDTAPNMGTCSSIGNPLFFQQPPLRAGTRIHSPRPLSSVNQPSDYWPFTISRLIFLPDFTNKTNRAEQYAKGVANVRDAKETKVLPVFLKYLQMASDEMEEGLKLYRAAAYRSPESKREQAVREVVVAEQMQRMMQSDHAILEFEDLRLQWVKEQDSKKAGEIMNHMEDILRDEIARTELSLIAVSRDSRLGFQFEQDYIYTSFSLKEKLKVLNEALNEQLPASRKKKSVS